MATAEEIRGWFAANPGASDAQIAAAMQANNVSSGEVAAAMGVDPGMVAQRYAAATAPAATPPPAAAAPVSPQDWQLGVSGGLLNARRAGQTDAQYYGAVALAANKYLGNPGTAAEAFDAMSKAGISVSDLLNAGISQQAIDAALTLPTNPVQLLTNTAALNSMASTLAQNPLMAAEIGRTGLETIYKNAREYVGALQQGGLTDAERNKLREAAAGQGWSYADIRAAGLDPMLLFGTPKPVVPPPPPPPPPQPPVVVDRFPNTQTPYTTVNVYQPLPTQPDLYAPGQPALDTAFRESAPRTAIPGMPGAYEYTPAAKLRPATGAGYSWTPPVVTSRPRSLLSPTLLSYVSPSQQFAQSRAAQDQALLGAFRQSGLPQNASNFYSWRNRLRSGEFGAGSAFDPTAFQSAFGSWAATQAPGTPAQGTVPVGDVTGYSDIAGRIQPIDLRTVPTFAEGGEASARELLDRLKKPEGAEAESLGAFEQIQAAERAARLRGAGTPLERYTYETLGLEPGLDRAMILPFAGRGADRELAMPGIVYEAAKALMTPGAVASGVPVSYEDVANLAGNVMGTGYALSTPIDGAVAGMAVKQKGGNWLAGEIERAVAPLKTRTIAGETPAQRIPRHEQLLLDPSLNTDQLDRVRYLLGVTRSEAATDDWIDKALSKYIRNEMATPEDPVRIQADAWAATKADLLAKKDAQIAKATADMEKARAERGFTPEMMTRSQAQIRELQKERDLLAAQTGLHMPLNATGDWLPPMNERKRIEVGMPPTPMGVSPEARFWEEVTDNAIDPTPASFYKQGGGRASIFANNPWLQQVPNEALVNSIPFSSSEALGFGHLIDEMRNALNPESGLPRELLINLKDLPKLTVPQMVERVSKINAWRSVQKAEADAARAANAATFPYRTYETIPGTNQPNERGLRWVELRTPEDGSSDALKDALKYEGEMLQHCVGGYCPEVEAGQSRIFSLRDARGQPYTTIEVTPPRPSFEQAKKYLDRDEPDLDENEKIAALFEAGYLDEEGNVLPDEPSRIKQIKSTRNRAPAEEYLPFVQDFVRSGQWSTVGDLKNTGLERASDIYDAKELSMLRSQGREVPDYLTKAEIAEFDKLVRKNTPGMAKGGPVQGYANGGEVTTPQTESRSMLERLSRFTSLDTPQDMSLGETVADIGMGFLPVVGTAQGMRDFERARREDDTLGMVLGAAGMVPVAGGAVRAARKAAKAAKEIPGAARQMLDEVSPLVMYRGLTRAIDPTKTRGVNKLIFMSPDPQVASGYALNNKLFGLPSEDMQTTDWAERQLSNAREFDPEAAPNVFKLNIRPQNTFDFQNEAHIAQLEKDLPKILARATPSREPYTRREIKDTIEGIKKGRWQYIEDVAQNTDFFEKAGFDSLYVDEGGVKNLGVFDPTLIKSAIGNEGTFDPTSPVITKADGGEVTAPQTESRSMLERLQRFASLDTPQDMSLGETVADIGMGFLPIVGTAQGARDFERARREDDTLGMVLGAASMIPVVGGAAKLGKKAVGSARQMLEEVAPAARQIDTPEFKNWFGESKATDAKGNPLVLYHGSPYSDIEEFSDQKTAYGYFFTPDADTADYYTGGRNEGKIYPVYLKTENLLDLDDELEFDRIAREALDYQEARDEEKVREFAARLYNEGYGKNPEVTKFFDQQEGFPDVGEDYSIEQLLSDNYVNQKEVDDLVARINLDKVTSAYEQSAPVFSPELEEARNAYGSQDFYMNYQDDFMRAAQNLGYDGVVFTDPSPAGESISYVVFDPTQIKSAIGNEGTFDPTNPVITKAKGGEVTAPQTESRRLLDQVEAGNQGLRNLPLERMNARRARAGMDPYAPARPAASMLENIIRGGAAIPGTVGRYAERVVGSEDPLAKLGGDITGVGGAMLQGLKEDPLGFAADVAPIIGEIRSAADVDKYSALANEAIAAGNPALAKVYQEIVAMSAAGAVPLAGMATRVGGRVGKRGLIDAAERAAKEAAEQAPTEARQMLEALAPETGQLPAENANEGDSGIIGLPISPQGTLGEALTQLNITPQRMDEWRSSREGMRQEKVPQVQQAAEALREGKISTEEYQRTVQQYQPIKPLAAVQKMPTVEEIAMALGKNSEKSPGIVGVNVDIPDGTRVASRLDIPAYEKYDTWVVSLHDGNKTGGNAIGYGQAAVINNVDFMSSAKAALNIATGKSAKGTIARMYGSWENRDPQAVAQQARDILSGKAPDAADWTEVGMNPFRHSYFYRKSDGMPVASAEQVIQVGPLVLAKKPVTRPVESPEHEVKTPEGPRYFKKGGNVERVTTDNRKYF